MGLSLVRIFDILNLKDLERTVTIMSENSAIQENKASQNEQPVLNTAMAEKAVSIEPEKGKRKRAIRLFPMLTYEECLILANAIWEFASGQKIRRLTLFDQIGKSPESGPSRALITASSKYGLINGSTQSEYIELTQIGASATSPDSTLCEKAKANFELSIKNNDYLFGIYEQYKEMKVPSTQVMMDFLGEKGLDADNQQRCVDLFLVNAKYIGIIKVMSGTERIISIEHLLEDISPEESHLLAQVPSQQPDAHIVKDYNANDSNSSHDEWDKTCFYISPIGDEGSEQRKHADLFMGTIVEPALSELGFKIVRSDTINTAGMITFQIIEHLVKSKLVVADLSYHNPNVFYELSLRHSLGKPIIHLIRNEDSIPFDIHSFRTIKIDDSSIYTFVPQIESYKAAVTAQARQLLDSSEPIDNPITSFFAKNNE